MGQIEKQLKGKVVFKHETEAVWHTSNNGGPVEYVPAAGEKVLYDRDANHDYTRIKYGDGTHIVAELPFSTEQPDWLQTDETAIDHIKNKPPVAFDENGELNIGDHNAQGVYIFSDHPTIELCRADTEESLKLGSDGDSHWASENNIAIRSSGGEYPIDDYYLGLTIDGKKDVLRLETVSAGGSGDKSVELSIEELASMKNEIGAKAIANNKADKSVATTTKDGLMSKDDKSKLEGLGIVSWDRDLWFSKNSGGIFLESGGNLEVYNGNGQISLLNYNLDSTDSNATATLSIPDIKKLGYTNIAYGTCSTAAATAAKVITISGNTNWALTAGSRITVKFTNTNTASNPTFNVNNTGAKKVWYDTAVITTSSLSYAGYANRPMDFVYDGTQYVFTGWSVDSNSTYSNAKLGQGYGTCSTAASTTAKVVTLSSYALIKDGIVAVKFTNSVPASATMNINSKGAKAIYYKGAAITANVIKAGDVATFIYDGTQYHLLSVDRACSVATSSADGLMSSRDKNIFDAFGFYTSGSNAEMLTTNNIAVQAPSIRIDAYEEPIGISTGGGKYTTVSSAEIVDMKNEIGAKSAVTTLETRRNAIIKEGSAEGSTISGSAYNGVNPAATAAGAHSEGGGTQAKSDGAHTEGVNTVAGRLSQADTTNTTKVAQIIAPAATELGMPFSTTAEQQAAVFKLGGFGAHAEGFNTQALGTAAHTEGNATQALANATHAEGDTTKATGEAAHSEGYNTKAKGNQSHAEGLDTEANGNASHTEGRHTKTAALAAGAHAEGISTQANADGSHAAGIGTKATTAGQTVVGTYNDDRNDLFTVGCGTSNSDRKSAFGVNTAGNTYVQNRLYVHGGARFTDNGGTNPSVEFNTPVTFAKDITVTSNTDTITLTASDFADMKNEIGAKQLANSIKDEIENKPKNVVSKGFYDMMKALHGDSVYFVPWATYSDNPDDDTYYDGFFYSLGLYDIDTIPSKIVLPPTMSIVPNLYSTWGGERPPLQIDNIWIPPTVTKICTHAFSECKGNIVIPVSVKEIEEDAFFEGEVYYTDGVEYCSFTLDLTEFITEPFPTLTGYNYNMPMEPRSVIKVIKGRKAELLAMTNWADFAADMTIVEV